LVNQSNLLVLPVCYFGLLASWKQDVEPRVIVGALTGPCHVQGSFLRSCHALDVVKRWKFEVDKVIPFANTGLFSQSCSQGLTFYLAEPVWLNAVVEALAQYLVLNKVFKGFKHLHDHLPRCQIL
jgi:hypothetical protein